MEVLSDKNSTAQWVVDLLVCHTVYISHLYHIFFLVESWIRVMYWVLIVITKMPFYPLKAKDICNIYTHMLNIRGTLYTRSFFVFIFFNVQFMK